MRFAPLVTAARRRLGLRQEDLAAHVGVSPRAIWQLEQGGGTLMTLIPVLTHLRIAITGLPLAAHLGARVQGARRKRDWSLATLSERSKISIPTIQAIEAGRGRVTSLEEIIAVLAPTARERRFRPGHRDPGPIPTVKDESSALPTCSLIQGDCIEIMPTIEAGSVSLV